MVTKHPTEGDTLRCLRDSGTFCWFTKGEEVEVRKVSGLASVIVTDDYRLIPYSSRYGMCLRDFEVVVKTEVDGL